MAFLDLELRTRNSARGAASWRLDQHALAAPLLAAGRDWLRLQDHRGVDQWPATVGWILPGGQRADSGDALLVELRAPGAGGAVWQGSLPRDELARIARRAVAARRAAGLWPQRARDGERLTWRLRLVEGEAVDPGRVPCLPPGSGRGPGSDLGIDWGAQDAEPPAPARADPDAWHVIDRPGIDQALADAPPPDAPPDAPPDRGDLDVVLAFRPGAWQRVHAICDDSFAAGEERALLLRGRRLRTATGGGFVPLFDVVEASPAPFEHASATRIVLEHTAFGGRRAEARAAADATIGLLHTHLADCGLEASDHDRRDIDDIDSGGPTAISIICTARAHGSTGPLPMAVYGRLGRRRGQVRRATARVLVAEPRPLEVQR